MSHTDLRSTLDRNVTIIDETMRGHGKSPTWCLRDEEAKSSANAVTVSFNVFEVKLVAKNPMSPALAALISEGTIDEASKCSKFLTSAATFQRVQKLPYWPNHPEFPSMYGFKQCHAGV